jgi:8-oxo-dGTP diphosphatase
MGSPVSSLVDFAWRTAFRLGFPFARMWWRIWRPHHESAVVAIYVGTAVLLVHQSYRRGWHLPGGSIRRGETPDAAARRELAEELSLVPQPLLPAGVICGVWGERRDRVHIFELRLVQLPKLTLDNREIIGARLFLPSELHRLILAGPTAVYFERSPTERLATEPN